MSVMLPDSTSPFINRSIRRIRSSVDVLQKEIKHHTTSISFLSDITKINENNLIKNNEIMNNLVQKFSDSVEKYNHIHERYDIELMSLSEDLSNLAIQITEVSKQIIDLKSNIASVLGDIQMIKGSIHLEINLKCADIQKEIKEEFKETNNKNRDDINLLKSETEKCKKQQQKTLDYTNRRLNELEDKIERKCCVIS